MHADATQDVLRGLLPVSEAAGQAADTIADFAKLYYHVPVLDGRPAWKHTTWRGIPAQKCPLDLWLYQELIHRLRPSYIVETGVAAGGSTAFLADMCRLIGHGVVISIDLVMQANACRDLAGYDNVELIAGSSTADDVVAKVHERVDGAGALVILDSDHTAAHVADELECYADLVPPGGYLVCEDTNINGHPVYEDFGPGPMEAVAAFLRTRPDFTVDTSQHKFHNTFNPNGYLRRATGRG